MRCNRFEQQTGKSLFKGSWLGMIALCRNKSIQNHLQENTSFISITPAVLPVLTLSFHLLVYQATSGKTYRHPGSHPINIFVGRGLNRGYGYLSKESTCQISCRTSVVPNYRNVSKQLATYKGQISLNDLEMLIKLKHIQRYQKT